MASHFTGNYSPGSDKQKSYAICEKPEKVIIEESFFFISFPQEKWIAHPESFRISRIIKFKEANTFFQNIHIHLTEITLIGIP